MITRFFNYISNQSDSKILSGVARIVTESMDPLIKPLCDLSILCESLKNSYIAVHERVNTLEEQMNKMQTTMSALCVQITTLNQTISNASFTAAQPLLASDIPTSTGFTQVKNRSETLPPRPMQERYTDLLLEETCRLAKADTNGTKEYLEKIYHANPTLSGYMESARKVCNCCVPDHYLIAIYLSVSDNVKDSYPQTLAHIKTVYPGDLADKKEVRHFLIKMSAKELAEKAGAKTESSTSVKFGGCPSEEIRRPKRSIAFLKSINY